MLVRAPHVVVVIPRDGTDHFTCQIGRRRVKSFGDAENLACDVLNRESGDQCGGVAGGAKTTLDPLESVSPKVNALVEHGIGKRALCGGESRAQGGVPSAVADSRSVLSLGEVHRRRPGADGAK